MSQITSQYGDSLINGLLAGMKYQHFKEDLKLSRLQRAEYEATTGYREGMRNIAMQKAQSELIRNQLGEEADRVTAQFAQPQAEAGLAQTRARTKGAEADTAQTEQSTKFAALLQPSRMAESTALADRAGSEATSARLGTMSQALGVGATQGRARGMTGLSFGIPEATTLAAQQVEALGIKDESAKGVMQSQFLQGILGGVESGRQEIAQNNAKLSEAQLDNYLKSAGLAAHVASYGQAGVAGAEQLLGQDHPITKAASLMIAGVPQAVAKPVPESAMTKEDAKALAQEWKQLHKDLREAQTSLGSAKLGSKGMLYGRNVDAEEVKTQEAKIARIQDDIKANEQERGVLENPKGIQNSTGFMKDTSSDWPQDIQDFMKKTGRPILVKPTPDNITKARAEMKKLGK